MFQGRPILDFFAKRIFVYLFYENFILSALINQIRLNVCFLIVQQGQLSDPNSFQMIFLLIFLRIVCIRITQNM